MQSQWMENHEREMKELQAKSTRGKKPIYIIMPVMMLIILVAGLTNSSEEVPRSMVLISMGAILVPLALVFLMAILLSKKAAKKDLAKKTREHFMELHLTDEQVMDFDREMAAPHYIMDADVAGKAMFMPHFIAMMRSNMGAPEYSFAKIEDIASRKDSGVNGEHYVDLLDHYGQIAIGITVKGKKELDLLDRLLAQYCPGI